MARNLPSIPDIPLGEATKKWFDPIKETIEIWRGERRTNVKRVDEVVTYQKLVDLGLITEDEVPK